MTTFRYPFTFLMRKTQWEIEIESRELINAKQMISDKTQQIEKIGNELGQWENRATRSLFDSKGVSAEELLRFRQYVAYHHDKLLESQAELVKLESLESDIYDRLISKKTELRAFEKHEGRMLKQHNYSQTVAEDAREESMDMMRHTTSFRTLEST